MSITKTLKITIGSSNLGASYTWEVVSQISCTPITFTVTSGTITSIDVSNGYIQTMVTYPDDCDVIVYFHMEKIVNNVKCENILYFDLTRNETSTDYGYQCISGELGCQLRVGTNLYSTINDCQNCTNCPCKTNSACNDAIFNGIYNCNTKELTITTSNLNAWCTNQVVENITITGPNMTSITIPVNENCLIAFPFNTVVDLPNGTYSIDVYVNLGDCEALINTVLINCGTGITNFNCCASINYNDNLVNMQHAAPKSYSLNLNTPLASEDLIIDFNSYTVADRISLYASDWNGTSGTLIATSGYVGKCTCSCCNYCVEEYQEGYVERIYTGSNTYTDNNPKHCSEGYFLNIGTSHTLPNDWTLSQTLTGAARVIITQTYLQDLINNNVIENGLVYVVVESNDCSTSCENYNTCTNINEYCSTAWQFKIKCQNDCPCIMQPPVINIVDGTCENGLLTVTTACQSGGCIQYCLGNGCTDWQAGLPQYSELPDGTGLLRTRCVNCTDPTCESVITEVPFNKPHCCIPYYEYEVLCESGNKHIIYTISDCEPAAINLTSFNNTTYEAISTPAGLVIDITIEDITDYSYYLSITCTACGTDNLIITSGTVDERNAIDALTCVCPTATITSNSPVCEGETLIVTLNIAPPIVYTTTWFLTNNSGTVNLPSGGGVLNNNGLLYTKENVTANDAGTYTVLIHFPNNPECADITVTKQVQGFRLPNPPTVVVNSVQICEGVTTATLTAACNGNQAVNWYTVPIGGTKLITNANYIVSGGSLVVNNIIGTVGTVLPFYVECQNVNQCTSNPRVLVTVTIIQCCAPISINTQPICLNNSGGLIPINIAGCTSNTILNGLIGSTNSGAMQLVGNQSSGYSILYPASTNVGSYGFTINYDCMGCIGVLTSNITLNKPTVSSVNITNNCPNTTINLYTALTSPQPSTNSNTVFKIGSTCSSTGALIGGIQIPNASNYNGTSTIYYEYTDNNGCKACGQFNTSLVNCCNLNAGNDTNTQICF